MQLGTDCVDNRLLFQGHHTTESKIATSIFVNSHLWLCSRMFTIENSLEITKRCDFNQNYYISKGDQFYEALYIINESLHICR